MKKSKSLAGWYHDASTGSFGEIRYFDQHGPKDMEFQNGPFETFTAAKADAIGYFQADVALARQCIATIRALRK